MDNISGYDRWKEATPEEADPVEYCVQCGEPLNEEYALYTIDGGYAAIA